MKKLTIVLMSVFFMFAIALPSWSASKTKTTVKSSAIQKKKPVLTHKPSKDRPDLIVSIQAPNGMKAGEKIPSCKVKVTNIGKATARGTQTAGNNGYMVDIVLSSDGHIPVTFAAYSTSFSEDVLLQGGRISNTPDLKPGQSKVFSLPNYLLIPADTPTGGYCLGGVVDSGKKVVESNERNNTCCHKMRIKGADKPDLIVSDIKVVKDCWIKVTIKNISTTAGLPSWVYSGPHVTKAGIQMYTDGAPWGGMIIKMFDPTGKLKHPNSSVSKLWFKGSPGLQLPSGLHSVKVIVDVHNKIDESNDTNNTLTRRLKCKDAQQEKPLQVTNLVNSQDFKLVGGKIQITVKFNKDVNIATVIPKSTFKVKMETNPNADGTITWSGNRTLIWTSSRNYHDLCVFDSDCFFTLTITDSVKDTGGGRLDGDKNGAAGGDFNHNFTIIG